MDTQSQIQYSPGGVKEGEWTAVVCESKEEEESWPLIKRGFTVPRKKELEEQAAINKHICEGQNPSFLGYNLQGFGCENMMMMDPEPGRCRRTDGKKWRCSRDVLSEQKYCERHIHRGRQRSRKLVEPPEFASSHSSTTTTIVRAKAGSSLNPNQNLPVSAGLQLMTPSSAVANVDNDACGGSGNKRACYAAPLFVVNDTSTTVSSAVTTNARVRSATMYDSGTDNTNEKKIGHGILIRSGSGSNDFYNRSIAVRSHMSPGLGFSPKSVLQVAGGDNLFVQSKSQSHVAFEPGRCRRTDGKKWQCRREVVPAQKYCPRHMHRGAKRLSQTYAVPSPTTTSPAASNTVLLPRPPPLAERRCPAPNTNLCISTPTSPPPNDESSSSTSSDTTITDTSS